MEGIKTITSATRLQKLLIFGCVSCIAFLLSASISYAGAGDAIASGINSAIFTTSITIGGFIVGLGGVLLDISLDQMVLEMGSWFRDGGIGGVVNDIWTMIRDLFNIVFIFSLVYIGLRIIYDSDDSRTKRTLGLLIAAALLINFSLYIAKVVVDVSNFTAVEIYSSASGGIAGEFGVNTKDSDGNLIQGFTTSKNSISGAYMQVLNISSWFKEDVGDRPNAFAYSVFLLLFLGYLGLVFAYGALMLVARFIAIVFYLMFSPFMFLGWVLPQFQSYSTKWWQGFLAYCFFAPVYIFMLYIGLYALQQMKSSFGGSFSAGFVEGGGFTTGTLQVFLFYAIGTGFLYGAMKVASMLSSGGAAMGMGAADKMSRAVTGRVASGTIGAGANWVGNRMDAKSAKSGKPRGRTGRAVRSFVDKGTTSKFGASTSRKERTDADKDERKRHASAHDAHSTRQTIMTSTDPIEREAAIAGASTPTLVEMTKTSEGREALYAAAGSLKDSQVKDILKSDDVPLEVKTKLAGERQEHVRVKISEGGTLSAGLKKASTAQLESLDFKDDLMNNAMYLQESQMDDLKKKWDDNETFRLLKEEREKQLKSAPIDQVIDSRKTKTEIAKLPKEILETESAVQYLERKGFLDNDMMDAIGKDAPGVNKRTFGNEVLKLHGGELNVRNAPTWVQNYFTSNNGAKFLPETTTV